jgi:threonine dehydrogenase-like Zn-dependent dehydrogenase
MTHGGKCLLFGCYPQDSEVKLNPYDIYSKELRIYGSQANPFTFPQAIQLVRDMTELYFDFDKLGINLFQMTKYESALAALTKERVEKIVFET